MSFRGSRDATSHRVTAESEDASLRELKERLRSLHDNYMTNLAAGSRL